MPLYSLKLSTYDPDIIDAFNRLRKSRKQATFTHEAIKQFLTTERGKQVLRIMEGVTSGQQLTAISSTDIVTPDEMSLVERISATGNPLSFPQDSYKNVLNSILK